MAVATSVATGVATGALEVVDALLVAMTAVYSAVAAAFRVLPFTRRVESPRPSVVIVGASFAGLWAQRSLCNRFDVTLVDMKEYFEYTPGALRLFVQPSHLKRITRPLPSKRCAKVIAQVTEVTPSQLAVRYASGQAGTIPFDYLLLACGSLYPAVHGQEVVKPGAAQSTLVQREACWAVAARRLADAEDAIVVGGGPVGVELAAEIKAAYPKKRVVLISRSERLCAALPPRVGEVCLRWLERHQVEVLCGVSTSSIKEDGVTLTDGRSLRAAAVYNCCGGRPNSAMLKRHFGSQLDAAGRLLVNDHLQVDGHPHIFGMGDLIHHPASDELKLGHTAELNAHVVAHNVLAMHEDGKAADLATYPQGAHRLNRSPQVYCVSLGKHSGALAFNGIVISGWPAAMMKWLLEWTKVAACAERPVGTLFWSFADAQTALLSRTILPVPEPYPTAEGKAPKVA